MVAGRKRRFLKRRRLRSKAVLCGQHSLFRQGKKWQIWDKKFVLSFLLPVTIWQCVYTVSVLYSTTNKQPAMRTTRLPAHLSPCLVCIESALDIFLYLGCQVHPSPVFWLWLEGRGSCILATSGDRMRLGRIYYLIIQTIMPWSAQAQHTLLSLLSDRHSLLTLTTYRVTKPSRSWEIYDHTALHYFLGLLIKLKLSQLYSALILTFQGRREFWNIMNNSNF